MEGLEDENDIRTSIDSNKSLVEDIIEQEITIKKLMDQKRATDSACDKYLGLNSK